MQLIKELVQELKEENLLDQIEYIPFDQQRNHSVPRLNYLEQKPSFLDEPSQLTQTVTKTLVNQSDIRYSISTNKASQQPLLPQPRMRLIKKTGTFARVCKCCSSNVFILDAYCNNCNERMIGNFLYYSFFLLCASMIGFMIFYMATANPY